MANVPGLGPQRGAATESQISPTKHDNCEHKGDKLELDKSQQCYKTQKRANNKEPPRSAHALADVLSGNYYL